MLLTQFSYMVQGQVCELLKFRGDRLEAKDSFIYDSRGRLVEWRSYFLSGIQDDYLTAAVWHFRYKKQRITDYSVIFSETAAYPSGRLHPLQPVRRMYGKPRYHKDLLQKMDQFREDFRSNQPTLPKSQERYRFRYEFHGTK